jgi:hypothetical protein
VKSASSFKINIPEEVEAKIRYLCSVIHDVEWSGTLFYTCEGSLDDGTFEVTCVDLFVMDIGTSSYTEYKESADIINYRVNNDLLREDIREGLIHSHNNMATFFSTTDQSTLKEEGTNMNHFVSLIVNNAGTYTAAVTRKVITEKEVNADIHLKEKKYYNTYDNVRIDISAREETKENQQKTIVDTTIEYFELRINKHEVPNNFSDIEERILAIRKAKRPSTTVYGGSTWNNKGTTYPSYGGSKYTGTVFNQYNPTSTPAHKEPEVSAVHSGTDAFSLCLTETFDEDLIEDLCIQLLTGSILYDKDNINLAKWVVNMDDFYENRFGILDYTSYIAADQKELEANNERLESWINGMIEFLVYTRDEALLSRLNALSEFDVYDESDTSEVCAYGMYKYLSAITGYSYVRGVMLNLLENYLPDGIEEYL